MERRKLYIGFIFKLIEWTKKTIEDLLIELLIPIKNKTKWKNKNNFD